MHRNLHISEQILILKCYESNICMLYTEITFYVRAICYCNSVRQSILCQHTSVFVVDYFEIDAFVDIQSKASSSNKCRI